MTNTPPATVGTAISAVDTPALLIDLDAFEKNIAHMQAFADKQGMALRPHAKTHKCPTIALQQVNAGAVGVCCQKVGEAEAMVYGGVRDVFVTNEIVGEQKLKRLASLARLARISVCVDNLYHIDTLEQAADAAEVMLHVFIEIDVGAGRCGVTTGEATLLLALRLAASPRLTFSGLQAYHGGAQHIRDFAERRRQIEHAAAMARATADLLESEGIRCPLTTGAGTGTYPFEAASGVYGELQVGSYVFMDADYGLNLNENAQLMKEFTNSLFVYTTVISRPQPGKAILDAGLKALSVDSGMPIPADQRDVEFVNASDEHGVLILHKANAEPFSIGSKLKLIPGHCDPTVNLYDWYVCYRGDRVEAIWPITARGALL